MFEETTRHLEARIGLGSREGACRGDVERAAELRQDMASVELA